MKIQKSAKGFTLIELLVVVAITAFLSVAVTVSVINFQKDARLDIFTREFASALETARNRSVTGDIPNGVTGFETYNDPDDELPFWVVNVTSTNYSMYSKYKRSTDTLYFTSVNPETTQIPSGNSISPNVEIDFKRLTGETAPISFTVTVSGYARTETVDIDSNGIVQIYK